MILQTSDAPKKTIDISALKEPEKDLSEYKEPEQEKKQIGKKSTSQKRKEKEFSDSDDDDDDNYVDLKYLDENDDMDGEKDDNKPKKKKSKPTKPQIKRSNVIYLGHLPKHCEEQELIKFMTQFGGLKRVRVARSKKTGGSKGFAFVQFNSHEVASIVEDSLSGYMLFSKRLVCHVIPSEKLCYRKLFPKGTQPYQMNQGAKKRKSKHQIKRKMTIEMMERITARLILRERKRRQTLKNIGIDYDFPGYEEASMKINANKEGEKNGKAMKAENENEKVNKKNLDRDSEDATFVDVESKMETEAVKDAIVSVINNKEKKTATATKERPKKETPTKRKKKKKKQNKKNQGGDSEDAAPVDVELKMLTQAVKDAIIPVINDKEKNSATMTTEQPEKKTAKKTRKGKQKRNKKNQGGGSEGGAPVDVEWKRETKAVEDAVVLVSNIKEKNAASTTKEQTKKETAMKTKNKKRKSLE